MVGLLQTIRGRALLSGSVPIYVVNKSNPPDIFFDFTKNLAWKKKGGVVSATSLLTVSRASTKYVNDSAGNWTSFSSNALAWSNLGALIEEARTNSIRNNSMQGAVAGSPGTLPTNWSVGAAIAGITFSVLALGIENGIDYIDINVSGTAGATSTTFLSFDAIGAIAAVQNQTWSASAFLKQVSGTFPTVQLGQRAYDGGSGLLNAYGSGGLTIAANAAALGNSRQTFIQLLGSATTASNRPTIEFSLVNTTVYNFTIRIGWPQLELGASVTSPIRTTSAAVTRAADVVTLTSPGAFGSAYTSYVKATPGKGSAEATSSTMISFHDGTNNNQWLTRRDSTTLTAQVRGFAGGSGFGPGAMAAWTQNVSGKVAGAYAVSDQAESFNGASVVASASAAVLVPNAVTLGNQASAATTLLNGFLAEAGIWYSQRVPNSQLQSMTQ